jgi:hypothetical protein
VSAPYGSPFPDPAKYGIAGRMASLFIDSKLTPIVVAASLLLGLFSVLMLPREEEPQIKVPMIDILVGMPGATAAEVEVRVTHPMEKLLWEIPGVEYVYSTASPGGNMTVVRFKVGTDLEAALVRLNQKLQTNFDRIPLGVTPPLVKPRTIDDVPVLALTFHSERYDHATLRRIAAQVDEEVKSIPQVAETTLIGGDRRQIRVQLDPQRDQLHVRPRCCRRRRDRSGGRDRTFDRRHDAPVLRTDRSRAAPARAGEHGGAGDQRDCAGRPDAHRLAGHLDRSPADHLHLSVAIVQLDGHELRPHQRADHQHLRREQR